MTGEEVNAYAMRITQASATGLVVITYDLAIQYIDEALNFFNKGAIEEYRDSLRKSRACINELTSAINTESEIGINLLKIYLFMNKAINKADINKNTDDLLRINKMLQKLREAFVQVDKVDGSGSIMENTQQVYAGLTYSKDSLNENMYQDNIKRGYTV